MTPKPTGRGGPGRGQGRKPRLVPRKAVTVRLEPEDADKLRAICHALGVSQSEWISKQIRKCKIQ